MTRIPLASPRSDDADRPDEIVAKAGEKARPAGPGLLASVDLGSNSFRMLIARGVNGQLRSVDRLREGVRLAAYLDAERRITYEGRQRALDALSRFGQRVLDFPAGTVRAVGTNTLRQAKNIDSFLRDARKALGHPIEVISGREEARLIYVGAAHNLAGGGSRRLVVDIGGGSTEVVLGEGFEPRQAESLYMGCVSFTRAHFGDGRITAKRMRKAVTAARLELRSVAPQVRKAGWDLAVGASGTIQALRDLSLAGGWSEVGITAASLEALRAELIAQRHTDALDLPGLRRDRARVLPGGLAILIAVFEALGIDRMVVSSGALREGVLYDLMGRLHHDDARDVTIERLMEQYRVDANQARRVEATALHLLEQVADDWSLDRGSSRAFLGWAASLHEIGLAVAHAGHHKHGAYLVEHADLPGFSFQDQRVLALLIHGHRRRFPRQLFRDRLPRRQARQALRLCRLLRLAVLLNRSRSDRPQPPVRVAVRKRRMTLSFAPGWLAEQPLTRADLEQEASRLDSVGAALVLDLGLEIDSSDDGGSPGSPVAPS